jgi:Xaa-Pro aminopeptidase
MSAAVRPAIPAEEYPTRWLKLQRLMEALKLDLLIAYADDRAVFGPAHLRWLAGLPVHFEPMCFLIAQEGDPIVLCGPESDQYALRIGQVTDVRVLREFTHPDEDYPYSQIASLADVVASVTGRGATVRRVGVAGRSLMSADTWAALMAALPGVEWVDAERTVSQLRAVKTAAEVAVIRYAYRLAELGLHAAVDAIRPGVMESEIAAEAEAAMRRAGAEGTGIDTIVASGPNSRPILARATSRRVEANDLVLLTVAPRYQGYHGAIGRPVLVGNAPADAERALDAACRAQETCYQMMRAGVEGRAVEKAGRAVMAEAGLAQYFLYSGLHSVGVIEFEPPIFGPSSPATLEENMVISIDIPVFNAAWGGLRVEDGFLITRTGAERLNDTPFVIRK